MEEPLIELGEALEEVEHWGFPCPGCRHHRGDTLHIGRHRVGVNSFSYRKATRQQNAIIFRRSLAGARNQVRKSMACRRASEMSQDGPRTGARLPWWPDTNLWAGGAFARRLELCYIAVGRKTA